MDHKCLEVVESCTLPRRDSRDTPLTEGEVIYFDDSSKKKSLDSTKTGYARVTADKVIEAKALTPHFSAQAAELIVLTRACELIKGKSLTIYTDSQYVYSTLCVCQPVEIPWNGDK